MYEDILNEMEARGMLKEAKESNQNPWRDTVLGAVGAPIGAFAGGAVGARMARGQAQKSLKLMQAKEKARDAAFKRSKGRVAKVFPRYGRSQHRHGMKMNKEILEEGLQSLGRTAKSVGKGSLAGLILGGLAGVGASRLAGREKNASVSIEDEILFAAFEDELEKLSVDLTPTRRTGAETEDIIRRGAGRASSGTPGYSRLGEFGSTAIKRRAKPKPGIMKRLAQMFF